MNIKVAAALRSRRRRACRVVRGCPSGRIAPVRRRRTSRQPRRSMRAAPRWRTKSRGSTSACSPARRRSARATCSVSRRTQPRTAAARSDRPSRAGRRAPVPPPRPALKLIGVAEDSAAGSPVRTAIISAPDQLYVVKEGERVTSRYRRRTISPDVVELVDTGDAQRRSASGPQVSAGPCPPSPSSSIRFPAASVPMPRARARRTGVGDRRSARRSGGSVRHASGRGTRAS